MGIKDVFTPAIAEVAVALSGACDPQVAKNAQRVYDELARWGRRLTVGTDALVAAAERACVMLQQRSRAHCYRSNLLLSQVPSSLGGPLLAR